MKRTIVTIAALFVTLSALAQDRTIVWSGELRFRTEADGRDFRSTTPPSLYTLSRARIGAAFNVSEKLGVFVQIQDSRRFGEEASTVSPLGTGFDLHQAYIEVDDMLLDGLTLTLGKMELYYGNGRLFSSNGFNNVGRSFPGLVAKYAVADTKLDLMVLTTREPQPPATANTKFAYTRDTGERLAAVYTSTKVTPEHTLDVYAVQYVFTTQDAQLRDSLSAITAGLYGKGSFDKFFYEADASYMTGDSYGRSVAAFGGGARLGMTLNEGMLLSVLAGADIYSGTRISSTKVETFEPFFGGAHQYLGYMDYFSFVAAQTGNRGIKDLFVRAELLPAENVSVQATLHHFELNNQLTPAVLEKTLGQELNLLARWKHTSSFNIEACMCMFLPGPAMRAMYGGYDVGYWIYIMPQIKF